MLDTDDTQVMSIMDVTTPPPSGQPDRRSGKSLPATNKDQEGLEKINASLARASTEELMLDEAEDSQASLFLLNLNFS